jgi:molybdate transport system substrate-binding protein
MIYLTFTNSVCMKIDRAGLWVALIVAAALLSAGCASTSSGDHTIVTGTASTANNSPGTILVYAGAGLKVPMQEIGQAFTQKTGTEVQYSFGGSGVLISQMNLTRKGDVFIPGSTVEFGSAKDQHLVSSCVPVAYHVPVIAVQKGNPKQIASLRDFTRPGLKVALGAVNATAIGKSGAKMFARLNITDAVERNVVTRTPTINELTAYMTIGQADVALLTMDQIDPEKLDAIAIPADENEVLIVPVGATSFAANPESARAFASFVASDEGKALFAKHGFPAYPNATYANVIP